MNLKRELKKIFPEFDNISIEAMEMVFLKIAHGEWPMEKWASGYLGALMFIYHTRFGLTETSMDQALNEVFKK